MARLLTFPILLGVAVLLLGLLSMLRSLWPVFPERILVQLEPPRVQLTSEEVELILYIDSNNLDLSQPKFKTLDLPQEKSERYLQILSALRDNLEGLWPDALPLPIIFLHKETVIVHFQFDNSVAVTVDQEYRLYKSIEATLRENDAQKVQILVNNQIETFLGHIALANKLE
jgi:hypothetical protein